MSAPRGPRPSPRAQRGAVLITSLIFLVVLTMFVLAMLRSGTLEERMARNARDQQRALEAAEAVLRDAETSLFSKPPFDPYDPSQFGPACANGLCFKPGPGYDWKSIDWSSSALTRSFADSGAALAELPEQPRYIVEIVSAPFKTGSSGQCENGLARITARGVGLGGAQAFVQSTVRFRVFTNKCG